MDEKDRLIESLRAELKKAAERERDYKDARKATIYMLEDLNRTAEEVSRAEKEWEATFDSITDPIFIHDGEFNVVRANIAYAKAAGIDIKECIDRPYYEVFPKRSGPFEACQKSHEESDASAGETYEIDEPSTGRFFKMRQYPIIDRAGRRLYYLHILEDVTVQRATDVRLKREMAVTASLLRIAEATASTTDINRLMSEAVKAAARALKADACLSYVRDGEKAGVVFRPAEAFGLDAGGVPVFRATHLDDGLLCIKKAFEKKEPIFCEHYHAAGGLEADAKGPFAQAIKAEDTLVMPLAGRAGAIGMLMALYKARKEPDETDMKIAYGIMHQVSIAIEEARLYKDSIDKAMELAHKMETIQTMHEIDRQILSTLDPAAVLETAVMMISRIIMCDRATVALVDRDRGGFIYAGGFGISFIKKGTFVAFNDTNTTEVADTGRPQYVGNLTELKNPLRFEKMLIDDGFLSHIRVPLVVKGDVIGVLSLGSRRLSAFTPDDLSTIEKLASQIGVALENARLVKDLQELYMSTVKALSNTIDAKSKWTMGHSERVTAIAIGIARRMEVDENGVKTLELMGLLHDIGKIATYEEILDKPGKLTGDELKAMRLHPSTGASIIEPIKQLRAVIPGIKHHHEFYNGQGYPDGLKGEEIPLMARILTVADTVDAMAADRPYRKGKSIEEIMAELKRCSGTQFDPKVVEAFLDVVANNEFKSLYARASPV